jgi:hypothetical protein
MWYLPIPLIKQIIINLLLYDKIVYVLMFGIKKKNPPVVEGVMVGNEISSVGWDADSGSSRSRVRAKKMALYFVVHIFEVGHRDEVANIAETKTYTLAKLIL